jgi:hypothetical protein
VTVRTVRGWAVVDKSRFLLRIEVAENTWILFRKSTFNLMRSVRFGLNLKISKGQKKAIMKGCLLDEIEVFKFLHLETF